MYLVVIVTIRHECTSTLARVAVDFYDTKARAREKRIAAPFVGGDEHIYYESGRTNKALVAGAGWRACVNIIIAKSMLRGEPDFSYIYTYIYPLKQSISFVLV